MDYSLFFVFYYNSGQDAGSELCKAAANKDMEFVERLVKAGVDPNEADYSQRTPLHIVAADGTAKDVEFLVQEGADVLVKDRYVLKLLWFSLHLNGYVVEKVMEKSYYVGEHSRYSEIRCKGLSLYYFKKECLAVVEKRCISPFQKDK